jgi:glucose-1-phosphate cytidylyltransferase
MRECVVILCGGKGTRAHPATATVPKPLLDIAGRPVVRHVMDIYAAQGFTDFVLAAGYRKELLDEFAANLHEPWNVEIVDTGVETNTGARVRALADAVGEVFLLTYADGLADVDIAETLHFHRSHSGVATMTVVPLPSQYGTVDFGADDQVLGFQEKPVLTDHYINGGFFVLNRRCFEQWPDPGDDFERDVLPSFSEAGELFAYRHSGFWKSMDTYKDALELTALCMDGEGARGRIPPWTRPEPSAS